MGIIVKGTVTIGQLVLIRPRISISGSYQQIRIQNNRGRYYQYIANAKYTNSKGTRFEQVLRFNKNKPYTGNVCEKFYTMLKKMYPEHENHITSG